MMSAVISECGNYRYKLHRKTGEMFPEKGNALFIMLNPSTADADKDDPTIRRCVGFAKSWDCHGVSVGNLYAFRATNPKELWDQQDPVGSENNLSLWQLMAEHVDVVCAWGSNAKPERVQEFMGLALQAGARLWCLGTNKDGSPKHPLYIRKDQKLVRFKPPQQGE